MEAKGFDKVEELGFQSPAKQTPFANGQVRFAGLDQRRRQTPIAIGNPSP
jgi:hypothetical protein